MSLRINDTALERQTLKSFIGKPQYRYYKESSWAAKSIACPFFSRW